MTDKKIIINDVTLRDGMHAISHQYELEDMRFIAAALDAAHVDIIEISHGDGLSGNAINYGFSKFTEEEYITSIASTLTYARLDALLLPGIGTIEDLDRAVGWGIGTVRIATHCTEADIAQQHIEHARKHNLDTVGFLMMSHMVPPEKLAEQAGLMESYGAHCVYVVDSAGALLMHEAGDRVKALKNTLSCEVGYHAHNNLSLGVANTIVAIECGADRVDGSLAGLGAGAGNAPLEAVIAVANKMNIDTGCDLFRLMDAADTLIRPMMKRKNCEVHIDGASLSLGYAGVYSSFLLHARRAAERFDLDPRDILVELGKRRMVGGQEDMIVDVAVELSKNR